MKLNIIVVMASLAAFSAIADEPPIPTDASAPPDPGKVSYALGMNLGLQIRRIGADVDVNVIMEAVKDVLADKPTKLQASEMHPLFAQEEAYQTAKKKADGEAFLAKNAKADGILVLPDGLQYRILEAGAGESAKDKDPLIINFRGKWIDGTEFRHQEHIQVLPMNCPKGMQEALQRMKPGAKWQIFVPSDLAYGHSAGRSAGFGSTLIYELDLISIGPDADHPGEYYGAGRLGHSPGEDFLPSYSSASAQNSAGQTRANSGFVPQVIPEK
jgi:FKBP-type peptidyl-prolyl cis-trans isomerase